MNEIVTDRINQLVESLLPHGGGTMTEHRLRMALEKIAHVAWSEGGADGLRSLRTAEDAAEAWGVTPTRARAHISRLNQRWGVGAKIAGVWLLTRQEIEQHVPNAKYRRKPQPEE